MTATFATCIFPVLLVCFLSQNFFKLIPLSPLCLDRQVSDTDILMEVKLSVLSHAQCQSYWESQVTPSMICEGSPEAGICNVSEKGINKFYYLR